MWMFYLIFIYLFTDVFCCFFFFFSSRRRHTRFDCDWSSDVCSSDLPAESGSRQGALAGDGGDRRTSQGTAGAGRRTLQGRPQQRRGSDGCRGGAGERAGQRCRRDVELPGGEVPARPRHGHQHAGAGRLMKPPAWVIVSALLLAGMGTGGYVYWNGDQKALVRYKTAKIERGTVTQAVTATGTINPVITVQVGSQVSGIIKRLYADFNSVVKGGQVVAQIDPAPFQTAVTQMEANLQNAMGSLARARADLSLQKLNFDRAKVLFE